MSFGTSLNNLALVFLMNPGFRWAATPGAQVSAPPALRRSISSVDMVADSRPVGPAERQRAAFVQDLTARWISRLLDGGHEPRPDTPILLSKPTST